MTWREMNVHVLVELVSQFYYGTNSDGKCNKPSYS